MSKNYQGSCHCGAVKFSFDGEEIKKGLRCTCSMCARKGIIMSTENIPVEKLHIKAADDILAMYQFGQKKAKHFFCKQCGVYPFHETLRFAGQYKVNLGCIDGVDSLSLEADVFDGKNLL